MSKEKAISSEEMQMVTFELGDENYGIDILNVQEVIRMPIISKVPQTPSYVEGIIKLRGHVAPVINIRSKLGLPSKEANNTNRIIIVDVAGKKIRITRRFSFGSAQSGTPEYGNGND